MLLFMTAKYLTVEKLRSSQLIEEQRNTVNVLCNKKISIFFASINFSRIGI